MRKVIILVAALLLWQISDARPVSEEQARRNAASFFASVSPRTKASVAPGELRLAWSLPETATKAAGDEPTLYVFEMPQGGFIVASGDDAARPVLAYSLEGKLPAYADMPVNMQDTYRWYSDIIAFAREKGWSSAATKAESDTDKPVVLTTAPWNQWTPFNNLAPKLSGKECPIGCVATAVAIIMRYHQWPLKGTGTIPAYKYNNVNIDAVELGHEYDWSKMPMKATGFNTMEASQVSRLLYDIAVMVQMQFSPDGSGAYTTDAWRMTEYFGYDKSMSVYWHDNMLSQEKWEKIIKDEIDAERPVLYSGYEQDGGHAFVCDGYNGRYFSLNYGWGGGSAFYTLAPIEEHEEDLFEFTYYQYIITNIKPDEGGDPQADVVILDGLTVPYEIEQNKKFTFKDSWFYLDTFIPTDEMFTLTFSYRLFNSKGALKEKVSDELTMQVMNGFMYEITPVEGMISGKLEEGDWIALCKKDPATGEWSPVSDNVYDGILFDKRPLASTVKIGYDGDRPEDKPKAVNGDMLYMYFETLKDVPWAIYKEGGDTPVIWRNSKDFYEKHGAEEVTVKEDRYGDFWCTTYFWLPEGNYFAVFHNPLTGEEMKVHLEL